MMKTSNTDMTNNPTIDGVSRATIERIADRLRKAQMFKESTDLRALLDAPVVERQAVVLPSVQDDGVEGRGYNKALRDCAAALEASGVPFTNDPRIAK